MKNNLKSLILCLSLNIILITLSCSCTKKENKLQQTSQSTTIDIIGTWYDLNNTSDWFIIKDTTPANTGAPRYYITHYKYTSQSNAFIAVSEIVSLPGYYSNYNVSGNSYNTWLSFVNGVMKMSATYSGQPDISITYTKQ